MAILRVLLQVPQVSLTDVKVSIGGFSGDTRQTRLPLGQCGPRDVLCRVRAMPASSIMEAETQWRRARRGLNELQTTQQSQYNGKS